MSLARGEYKTTGAGRVYPSFARMILALGIAELVPRLADTALTARMPRSPPASAAR